MFALTTLRNLTGLSVARTQITHSLLIAIATILLISCGGGGSSSPETTPDPTAFTNKAALGESLFFDENLSLNRSQSCSTCHDPEHAFIDARPDSTGKIAAVSLGDDGSSLGDRNTPTVTYALFSPDFHQGTSERINSEQSDYQGFIGGQFLDGREVDLKGQASGPPLNPIEMAMPDKASVVERLLENSDYEASFKALFGDTLFDDDDLAYAAMAESIAEFEKTEQFFAFDSKYDRFLAGDYDEYILTKAALGKALFFSQTDTNCATCHQLNANGSTTETFTSYEYHNIGVPVNEDVRAINGKTIGFVDIGLFNTTAVTDETEKGKFKVPTLRNVAVTEPYMHNGVFRDLETVIKFYDHFLSNSDFNINPETGSSWRDPEVDTTVSSNELEDGDRLTTQKVEGMVCFLRSLTDARYEHLIEEKGIDCEE